MRLPPPGCWSCGAVPSEEDIARGTVLRPREEGEGGPWTRLLCPACGVEGALEAGTEGAPVLAPPEAAGVDLPAVATLLEGRPGRDLRRRAREWMRRYGAGLEALRSGRTRGAPPPPPSPPPPRGRDRRGSPGGRASPPHPPVARSLAPAGLPSTPAEARAVLGLPDGATRKEIDAAYRKASRRCHPDLVAHLDEDFQHLAHEKFLRIQRAREILTA